MRRPVGVGWSTGRRLAGGLRGGAPLELGGEPLLHRRAGLLALRLGLGRVVVRGRAALARRLDARRLALLLAVVRRPRRVAQALGLVRARESSSSASSDPTASSMPAPGSPLAANRAGTVASVNASASTSATSSHASGIETRASGSGRTEYADATVRSFAFWL